MNRPTLRTLLLATLVLAAASPALASHGGGFDLAVLVDGVEQAEYPARGNVYVEAHRGHSYALRISNPRPYRVAVALSVDGLNTIDAKHTTPVNASKWVIEPYDSIVISGWQVDAWASRQFFFTGERHSYGAALGKTENLGVIEAVFFKEKEPVHVYRQPHLYESPAPSSGSSRDSARREVGASAQAAPESGAVSAPGKDTSDDYAATGMGSRRHHAIERISMDLEKTPVSSIRIRYEFRPQLISLGVLPRHRAPMDRRESAQGFEYCPQPGRP